MIPPEVKGLEFEKSQKSWMQGIEDIRFDRHIRIISPVHLFSPLDEMLSVSGEANHILPFSNEVYGKSISGQLIQGCKDRAGIEYDKQLKQLTERIVGNERDNV